jgi:hypothetical protein
MFSLNKFDNLFLVTVDEKLSKFLDYREGMFDRYEFNFLKVSSS